MIVRLDRATGGVTVDGTLLAAPTFRQFCDFTDALLALPDLPHDSAARADLAELDSGASDLNRTIFAALGAPTVDLLPLASRDLTARLLHHWRTCPLDAWTPAAEATDRRPQRSLLDGGLAMRAVMYRILGHRMPPAEVDAMELPQLAMVLGVDDPDRDLDPTEERGGSVRGGRTTTTKDGQLSRYRFRRRPDTPYIFKPPPGAKAGQRQPRDTRARIAPRRITL